MISFAILAAIVLGSLHNSLAAPSGITSLINYETVGKQLKPRQGGYYSFWSEGGGSFRCNQQGGGKYTCNWSGQPGGGFVAGTGFKPGGSRAVKYSGTYDAKGPGYLALYGWTRNPLIEYYIIESCDVLAPGEPWTRKGNFTFEEGTYELYTSQRVNKPSIEGTRTFTQFWSVRTEKRVGGTILITGANGSLALPAVKYLLQAYPSFNLVLTVRDGSEQDANTAGLRLVVDQHPDVQVSIRQLDLSSLENVRVFSKALLVEIEAKELPLIRTIICNAMTWNLTDGSQYSKDGYEMSFAVNHLAHFTLWYGLLSAMDPVHGRIVFSGSSAHWPEKTSLVKGYPTHVPEDLELLVHPKADKEGEKTGRGFQRYAVSRLVPIMVMYELNRRLKTKRDTESIRAIAVDPLDMINSRAFHQPHVPRSIQIMSTVVTWLLPLLSYFVPRLVTVEQAATAFVDVAVADKFAGQEGYYEGEKKVQSSPDSLDVNMQQALWRKSVEWCGLDKEGLVID
ncbi:endo-1,4-beta-xylanase [Alternaria panax]|uniref:endo-1,4-beta-xylanase n=1 Tax=Alternaria panax TaxID=48097 RepID=A0AAD4FIT2_9PLEO|nr:endo-1,4-beta-xylanase [Alternaria panax]